MAPPRWSEDSLELTRTGRSVSRNKTRVQFDITNEKLNRLNAITEAAGHQSLAETIQQALRLYEWLVLEAKPNYSLGLINENGNVVDSFVVELLL